MTIRNHEETLGALAASWPGAARVLAGHGIDFCCGGARTLVEVCREMSLDPAALLREIEEASQAPEANSAFHDWTAEPLHRLIGHIVGRHHAYLRAELPRLSAWLAAVRRAHGARDGVMLERLDAVFTGLREELEAHLHQEETTAFPAIERSDGWLGQSIATLRGDHETAGRALDELRRLTSGYRPPEHACATYRALYAGLEALERDLHEHIHLENNILFPRALADLARGRGC